MKKLIFILSLAATNSQAASVLTGGNINQWPVGHMSDTGQLVIKTQSVDASGNTSAGSSVTVANTSSSPVPVSITNQTLTTGTGTTDINTQRVVFATDNLAIKVSPVAATLPVTSTVQIALATGSVTTVNLSSVAATNLPTDIIFGDNGPAAGIKWKRRGCAEATAGVTNGFYLASSGTATITHNASGTCFDFYSAGAGTANLEYSVGREGQ